MARSKRPSRLLANVLIVVYFAVLTIVLFGDLLTSSRGVVSAVEMDVDRQFFAWRAWAFDELRAGRLPLWNPYPFGGVPALANFQYAVLYPPNWLHLVLPTVRAFNVIAALHVFLAGVLGAAWCRSRGSGAVSAALGGTVFALCGPYVLNVYAGHPTYTSALTWTPLLFFAIDHVLARRGSVLTACAIGSVAVAMQMLAGAPQPTFIVALAAGVYVIAALPGRPLRRWAASLEALAAMYALGAMLAAAQLLPAVGAGREGLRNRPLPYGTASSYSLPPQNLLTLIAPFPFGDDYGTPYAGHWYLWETSAFVGPAALVLAVVGAASSLRRRRDRAATIVALLALLVALGSHAPLFKPLYDFVPGFDRFRAPARFTAVAAAMIAVLASRGFDLLIRRRGAPVRAGLGVLVAATLVAAFAVVVVGSRPQLWGALLADRSSVDRSAAHGASQLLRAAAVLAQVGVALLLLRRARWIGYAIAVLLVADLAIPAARMMHRFYPQLDAPLAWRDALASLGPDDRTLTIAPKHPNLSSLLRVEDAWGYDPAAPARWCDLVGRLVGADPRGGDFEVRRLEPSPLWTMLRLRTTLPPTDGFVPVEPMPRAMLIDDAVVVDGPEASMASVLDPAFDPRRKVVLESQPDHLPQRGATGTVQVRMPRPDWMEAVVELNEPAILLITDAYSAGWRVRFGYSVTASQTRYELMPANHALRAVPLAAGKHVLTMQYMPRGLAPGLILSVIGVVLTAWLLVALPVRRRLAARRNRP